MRTVRTSAKLSRFFFDPTKDGTSWTVETHADNGNVQLKIKRTESSAQWSLVFIPSPFPRPRLSLLPSLFRSSSCKAWPFFASTTSVAWKKKPRRDNFCLRIHVCATIPPKSTVDPYLFLLNLMKRTAAQPTIRVRKICRENGAVIQLNGTFLRVSKEQ